ncbi:MAG: dUTP diphosphatase [Psittacicella sp.]
MNIKILNNKLTKDLLPSRSTEGSCGYDLRAIIDENIILHPGEVKLISTGFALNMQDPNMAAFIFPRSGLGHKHGIVLGNSTGVIDSDYQGEIKVSLYNRSTEDFIISFGDRIAQLVFMPVLLPKFDLVDEFEETQRGESGFGHTGVK